MKPDTYTHKGWLTSDHYIKRQLAILGYGCMNAIILYAIFLFMAIIITGTVSVLTKLYG